MTRFRMLFTLSSLMVIATLIVGCGERPDDQAKDKTKSKSVAKKDDDHDKHDHSDWWCKEHGVPEEMCSICISEKDAKKARAMFKDKGDWCELHDRAKSQCFKCDPSLYEKYVKMYEAHENGKKPPRPPDTEFQK